MKKAKKILTLVACAVLLVCISVGATIAYLTDAKSVQNTFTVGKVSITLDEADVNEYGEPLDAEGNVVEDVDDAKRVEQNEYKLMPGHTYTKDPTVTVAADSEESYIRMLVTLNNYADLIAIFNDATLYPGYVQGDYLYIQHLVNGWDATKWPCNGITVDKMADTITYEFRYANPVSTVDDDKRELEALFTEIKLPGTVKNSEIDTLVDNPATEAVEAKLTIDVVAQAIQTDGFNGDVNAAWAAFGTQTANN